MAAGSAAERAEAKGRAAARKRGREVQSLIALLPCRYWCLIVAQVRRRAVVFSAVRCGSHGLPDAGNVHWLLPVCLLLC